MAKGALPLAGDSTQPSRAQRDADPDPSVRRTTPLFVPEAAASEVERGLWDRTFFYSSVIKEERSDEREHSECFLETLVRPAVEIVDRKAKVVRSDELATNSISDSIDEHIIKAGLVIADLSFDPGNVLLELGGRRFTGRPYVMICREGDTLPSNLRNERTMFVDTHFGRYRSRLKERVDELAWRIEAALSPDGRQAQPIRARFPDFLDYFE